MFNIRTVKWYWMIKTKSRFCVKAEVLPGVTQGRDKRVLSGTKGDLRAQCISSDISACPWELWVKTDRWCLCLEKKQLDPRAINLCSNCLGATSQVVLVVKNPSGNAGDINDAGSIAESGRSPVGGHGNHSGILAWRIPWTVEPGRLQQYPGS